MGWDTARPPLGVFGNMWWHLAQPLRKDNPEPGAWAARAVWPHSGSEGSGEGKFFPWAEGYPIGHCALL